MPSRIIREGINSSERVEMLTAEAEVFYRRIMTIVDDFGRFPANPTLIRSAAWPLAPDKYTNAHIEKWLHECEGAALLRLYAVGKKQFLEYLDFRQQKRAKKSKYPDPPDDKQVQSECEANAKQVRSESALVTSAPHSDSIVCFKKKDGLSSSDGVDKNPPPPVSPETVNIDVIAETIYALHPKQKDRFEAMHTIVALDKLVREKGLALTPGGPIIRDTAEFWEQLQQIHAAWCRSKDWTKEGGRYCPKLHEWLDDRGWLKWPADVPRASKPALLSMPPRDEPPAMTDDDWREMDAVFAKTVEQQSVAS
jgi:hypothetical protein